MPEVKDSTFTITRQDLAHGQIRSLDNFVSFRSLDDEPFKFKTGVVRTDPLGFNFKQSLQPCLKFEKVDLEEKNDLGVSLKDLVVVVTITDVVLRIRELIVSFPLSDLSGVDGKLISIELEKLERLGFYAGAEIGVYVKPAQTNYEISSDPFWSESQIVFSATFVIRAAIDSSLFEINYAPFGDQNKDVLFQVDWLDEDVSRIPVSSSFEVSINIDYKTEFLLLQSNSKFGQLGARLIFASIMREIIDGTLLRAELDSQVTIESDSVQYQLKRIFEKLDIDFDEYAALAQSDSTVDKAEASKLAGQVAQIVANIGTTLSKQQFSREG